MSIRAGNKEVALRDAAKAAILLEPQKKQPEGRARLGKALFRKGSAHAAKGPQDPTVHLSEIINRLTCRAFSVTSHTQSQCSRTQHLKGSK